MKGYQTNLLIYDSLNNIYRPCVILANNLKELNKIITETNKLLLKTNYKGELLSTSKELNKYSFSTSSYKTKTHEDLMKQANILVDYIKSYNFDIIPRYIINTNQVLEYFKKKDESN